VYLADTVDAVWRDFRMAFYCDIAERAG